MPSPQPNVPLQPILMPGISGLNLDFVSTTQIRVSPGYATDFTNQIVSVVMQLTAPVIVNTAVIGMNGMDLAPPVADTLYAVMLVSSSTGQAPTGAVLTLTPDAPNLPFGYDSYRRIGWVFCTFGAALVAFSQVGNGSSRNIFYGFELPILIGGTSTTAATVSAVGTPRIVPTTSVAVNMNVFFETSAGPGDFFVNLFEDGIGYSAGQQIGGEAPGSFLVPVSIPCSPTQNISYFNDAAAQSTSLYLNGYLDLL